MLSIITPVLNGEKYIRQNIESVSKLKVPFEHIVVDGKSTDNTLDIVAEYEHLVVMSERNPQGMYAAINDGFKCSKGDFIAYVNCDDIVIPLGFEGMYRKIIANRIDLVYSSALFYYENDKKYVIRSGVGCAAFFLKHGILPFVQPSSIYSRKIFESLNGFDPALKIMGDLDLFQRMARFTKKIKKIEAISTVFYKYGESLGDRNNKTYQAELIKMNVKRKTIVNILFSIMLRINNVKSYYSYLKTLKSI